MSAAECMNKLVDAYIADPVQLGTCPPNPTEETYNCLCALPSFTSWYLSTLCINCNGGPNPFSNLMAICPSFVENITATYSDSCSPYGVKEAGVAPSSTGMSSSGNLSTTAALSSSNLHSTPSPSPNTTPTPSSSSTSTSSSSSTTGQTTVVLSMTTPTPEPSTSSKLSTLTAVAASPYPSQHSFMILPSNETTSNSPSSTFSSSTNETYTSTSTPTPLIPLSALSSNSGMSTGAKAGIGVGAVAATIGIGFIFISLLTVLRRRNSKMKSSGYGRRDVAYVGRGVGRGGAGNTSTTLAEMYHDDEPQFYRGFGGSDGYGGNGSGSGLGIAGIGTGPREKMGLVPSGRIREVMVDVGDEHRSSEFATPLHAEGVREIHHVDERISEYTEEEHFVAPQERDNAWTAPGENDAFQRREDATERYSTHLQDAGVRYSTAQESNYEAAMRPKSRIYSVVDSPVLDLGQADLSDEELVRLEDEERRIDEAIRESESTAKVRPERGNIGTAL